MYQRVDVGMPVRDTVVNGEYYKNAQVHVEWPVDDQMRPVGPYQIVVRNFFTRERLRVVPEEFTSRSAARRRGYDVRDELVQNAWELWAQKTG